MECCLCLEDERKTELIRPSCCKYRKDFHYDCLESYIMTTNTYSKISYFDVLCPYCRQNMKCKYDEFYSHNSKKKKKTFLISQFNKNLLVLFSSHLIPFSLLTVYVYTNDALIPSYIDIGLFSFITFTFQNDLFEYYHNNYDNYNVILSMWFSILCIIYKIIMNINKREYLDSWLPRALISALAIHIIRNIYNFYLQYTDFRKLGLTHKWRTTVNTLTFTSLFNYTSSFIFVYNCDPQNVFRYNVILKSFIMAMLLNCYKNTYLWLYRNQQRYLGRDYRRLSDDYMLKEIVYLLINGLGLIIHSITFALGYGTQFINIPFAAFVIVHIIIVYSNILNFDVKYRCRDSTTINDNNKYIPLKFKYSIDVLEEDKRREKRELEKKQKTSEKKKQKQEKRKKEEEKIKKLEHEKQKNKMKRKLRRKNWSIIVSKQKRNN